VKETAGFCTLRITDKK